MRQLDQHPKPSSVVSAHLKALLPFRWTLIRLKRALTPYQTDSDNDELALDQGLYQIELLKSYYGDLTDKVVLEMGTGWQPTIPVLLSLLGCKKIILTDIERLMDYATVVAAMSFVGQHRDHVAARLGLSPTEITYALGCALAGNFETLLNNLRMAYVVPCRLMDIESQSVDIIYSRAVLEHISRRDLQAILIAQRRMLKPDGMSCHIVDNSDHWAHHDKRLSQINYLRYNSFSWSWRNPRGQMFQNRLRHSEYLTLFESCGYRVMHQNAKIDTGAAEDAQLIRLAKPYKDKNPKDLAAVTSYLLCSVS